MSVRRTAIAVVLAAGAATLATPAWAGAAPDQPTGYVSGGYCAPNGTTQSPVSYVDTSNWQGRGTHTYVVKNGGTVVKKITLTDHSGTSFMLPLAAKGVTKAAYALSMTIDGQPARGYDNKVLPVVKGKVDCSSRGVVNLYLGEHKKGFCFNGIDALGLTADSTMLNGVPMKLTYTLDGVTAHATVPANGQWSKALTVAPGAHRVTIAGTGYKATTFKVTTTEQCPAED